MMTRLKVALSVAVFLASLGLLSRFLHWMNQPSDTWLYAGAFGALALLVVAPTIIVGIWRSPMLKP